MTEPDNTSPLPPTPATVAATKILDLLEGMRVSQCYRAIRLVEAHLRVIELRYEDQEEEGSLIAEEK